MDLASRYLNSIVIRMQLAHLQLAMTVAPLTALRALTHWSAGNALSVVENITQFCWKYSSSIQQ